MHPLLVHLPIGLLTVAPLPALLALLMPARRALFVPLTFFVLLLGTAGVLGAVMSGEAAEDSVEARGLETAAVHDTLEEHEELAETTRIVYVILTLIAGGIAVGGRKGKLAGAAGAGAAVVLLAGTLGGLAVLANTADHGGQLVHRHGIHAPLAPAADAPAGGDRDRDDHDRPDDDD
jgi:uncharacterized membrane protein